MTCIFWPEITTKMNGAYYKSISIYQFILTLQRNKPLIQPPQNIYEAQRSTF